MFWKCGFAWSRTVLEASFTASLNPLRFIPVTRLFIPSLLSYNPREYRLLLDRLPWRLIGGFTRLLRVDRVLLHGNRTRRYRYGSFDESRLLLYRSDVRKAHANNVVLLLDVAVQWLQSSNLRGHANVQTTLQVYTQAVTEQKRAANAMVLTSSAD